MPIIIFQSSLHWHPSSSLIPVVAHAYWNKSHLHLHHQPPKKRECDTIFSFFLASFCLSCFVFTNNWLWFPLQSGATEALFWVSSDLEHRVLGSEVLERKENSRKGWRQTWRFDLEVVLKKWRANNFWKYDFLEVKYLVDRLKEKTRLIFSALRR